MRSDVIHESKNFKLIKGFRKHKPDGKPVYYIMADSWALSMDEWHNVRDFVDPFRNRGERLLWKFKNRKEAVQMFSLLVLKWP